MVAHLPAGRQYVTLTACSRGSYDRGHVSIESARIERILKNLVAAANGDYDTRVPLEENDDEFLDVEIGVNYLLDELVLERDQNAAQSRQIAAQTTALVEALSTPIIAVWPGVLVLPIIGAIDIQRTTTININLLARVVSERAKYVILDLTGVETIATGTMPALLQMVRAIGLLGATCFVTGINSRAAQQIVELGDNDMQLRTLARVSDALALILGPGTKSSTR